MAKKQSILLRENSRSTLQNFNRAKNEQTTFPDFPLHEAAKIVFADPVINGAQKHFVNKFVEARHHFINKESGELDESFYNKMEDDFSFDINIKRALAIQLFRYSNAFIEVIRGAGTGGVTALNILNTVNVEPITEPNGDLRKVRWAIEDKELGRYPEWTEDEIIWVKSYDSGEGYSGVDVRAAYPWVVLKKYIQEYVSWLWGTGQYKVIYNFKGSNLSSNYEDFLTFLADHDQDPTIPFLAKGEMEVMMARSMEETESYIELLKYIDSQILIQSRVPPIDVGIPDASGRSNADAQSNNLSTTIKAYHRLFMDAVNNKLLPRMNKGNTKLVIGPVDRFEKKQVFEELQILQSIGLSNDALKEHMWGHGIIFKTKELFNKEEKADTDNPRDLDMMPSRLGEGEGEQYEGSDTGEEASTREEQLLTRSTDDIQNPKLKMKDLHTWEVELDD